MCSSRRSSSQARRTARRQRHWRQTTNYSQEISLDVEMAIAMAPGAQVVLFEGGDYNLILDAMASSRPSRNSRPPFLQRRSSDVQGAIAAHLLIAAQGHAFFQSSGDAGAYPTKTVAQPPGTPACTPPGSGFARTCPSSPSSAAPISSSRRASSSPRALGSAVAAAFCPRCRCRRTKQTRTPLT